MSDSVHPAASNHLPSFITAPGQTDVLMVVMAVILLLFALMIGVLYFRLHALPERFAHKKVQFEIVCVLALLAMFTHMNIFWIAGLLLALIDFPDFSTLVGGLLVGFGTRLGSGCTSGHGICGIARLSPRSIVATGVFMLAAIIVVALTHHVFAG
jgi:uncharacterized membrane protein YedE/YeeE